MGLGPSLGFSRVVLHSLDFIMDQGHLLSSQGFAQMSTDLLGLQVPSSGIQFLDMALEPKDSSSMTWACNPR